MPWLARAWTTIRKLITPMDTIVTRKMGPSRNFEQTLVRTDSFLFISFFLFNLSSNKTLDKQGLYRSWTCKYQEFRHLSRFKTVLPRFGSVGTENSRFQPRSLSIGTGQGKMAAIPCMN